MAKERKQTNADAGRRFPQMERIFDGGERQAFMEKIERTCRALDEQARSGEPRDQQRARAALAAYGRALELLNELSELRETMAGKGSNKAAAATITMTGKEAT
jgi:hypothetical protein